MSQGSRHPGWITLLPVLGTVLLLGAAGRVPSALPVRWLGSAPMRALGARSYSIYLWHWPVLILGSRWLPAGAPWAPPTLLALSLLLAEAAYRWVESPARWRWGRGAPPGRVLLLALTSSALVAAIGIGLREAAQSGARAGVLPTAPRGMAGLPSLQQVRNDLAVVYANGCHVGFQALAPAQGCRLGGAADAPAVLLFGDSHAAQWVPALQAVASAHGHALVAWTKSGCPSADVTVWVAATRSLYPECDAWREAVFARLAALRPALVVVSNLVGGATVIVDRATGERLSGAPAAAAFETGIARTLQRLKDAGLAVVLMRDTPHPKPDATTCLFAQTDLSPCERTRADAAPADAADLRAARAVGVPVWDLSGAICGPERCPLVVSAGAPPRPLVVYRDADHLTASFAATLAPALERLWSTQLPMAPAR
jgi:hypothetical protein